jgi:hypothetical protein
MAAMQGSAVTPLANVVANGIIDRYFANWRSKQTIADFQSGDPHVFTIATRDLVFRLKDKKSIDIVRPGQGGVNDVPLKVFSSFNNWPTSKLGPIDESVLFVGVAALPVDYNNKNSKDTLAVIIAGSVTIANTGTYEIEAGQKICWMVPDKQTEQRTKKQKLQGQPLDKQLFQTVPLEQCPASGDLRFVMTHLIGVALSGAMPGQSFDIVIGSSR